MNSKKTFRFPWIALLVIVLIYAALLLNTSGHNKKLTAQELDQMIQSPSLISEVVINSSRSNNTGTISIRANNGSVYTSSLTDTEKTAEKLSAAGIDYTVQLDSGYRVGDFIPYLMMALLFLFMFRMMTGGRGQGQMMNFGKSRAKLAVKTELNMENVAGMVEEKDELKEIVEFLKNPKAFIEMGARIPKGVILVGAPGTGKTLLAKAVAGEANVPFYSISGSDFVEMYVGVGAARVRDMFDEAKHNSPCIIFIDEIDAVARRRGTGLGGSHDEREQTLNQMLVEMDGFSQNQGIIVMAATNRVDILDPAIMRPGRFDRKIVVSKPDVAARESILKLHSKNKHLAADVDLNRVARTTAGYTGADLENLLNEAAISAVMEKKSVINQEDINDAFIKTGIGTEKKSKIISERDKKITAYHETGHAILFHLLEDVGPVHLISIIPTGEGAAGYTMPLPDKDDSFITKGQLKHMMMAAMGGRIAEELVCDDITTGASQDIRQVTKIARAMVMQYGMSDKIGMINCDENGDDVFLGYDIAHNKTYSDELLSLIDSEVRSLIDDSYQAAKELILAHKDVLEKSCALLIEKEKITGEEFAALF